MSSELNISDLHTTDRLPEYSRGELPPEERASVEAHLDSCPTCREELELLEALLSASSPELDASTAKRLYTPLPADRERFWRAGVWRAAAGIVILLTGYGIWLAGQTDEVESSWSADAALADWDADLAELRPGTLDLRVALGANGGPAAWPEMEGDGMEGLEGTWGEIE
jgi:anti-sigma factor RsiW